MKKGYHKTKDGRTAKKVFTIIWTREKNQEQAEKEKAQFLIEP